MEEQDGQFTIYSGGKIMTNRAFWKKLDLITKRENPPAHIAEFMEILKDGYEQNLDVIVSTTPVWNGLAHQTYLGDRNARFYICYTSKAHARNEWRIGNDGSPAEWNIMSLRDMMNNMFNKTSGAGLVFNPDSETESMVVLKMMLEILVPGPKEKPPMFRDA